MRKIERIENLAPIVQWVGGKRQLLKTIVPLLPKKIDLYVEPFLGGGALLFELQPSKAIINDFNRELMNLYSTVRESPEELLRVLREHNKRNCKSYYCEIRNLDRDSEAFERLSSAERAARIAYLNKTCFNGLFRVNQKGQFNSSYGSNSNPNIINKLGILAMHNYFKEQDIRLLAGDYKDALEVALKEIEEESIEDTFVYLDPPYMPAKGIEGVVKYTSKGFDFNDQIELKEYCDKLNDNGVKFMLSNSDTPETRELYKDYNIRIIKANRRVNSDATKRGNVNEILVLNYIPEEDGVIIF